MLLAASPTPNQTLWKHWGDCPCRASRQPLALLLAQALLVLLGSLQLPEALDQVLGTGCCQCGDGTSWGGVPQGHHLHQQLLPHPAREDCQWLQNTGRLVGCGVGVLGTENGERLLFRAEIKTFMIFPVWITLENRFTLEFVTFNHIHEAFIKFKPRNFTRRKLHYNDLSNEHEYARTGFRLLIDPRDWQSVADLPFIFSQRLSFPQWAYPPSTLRLLWSLHQVFSPELYLLK